MWLYFLVAMTFIWFTSAYLTKIDIEWPTAMLGAVLFIYALSRLLKVRLSVPRKWERPLSVPLGAVNGMLTGMTGSYHGAVCPLHAGNGIQAGHAGAGDGRILRDLDRRSGHLARQERFDIRRPRTTIIACTLAIDGWPVYRSRDAHANQRAAFSANFLEFGIAARWIHFVSGRHGNVGVTLDVRTW